MTEKLAKQKQLLKNFLSQVQYLQEHGIRALKLVCYPCDEFEKILQECVQIFGSEKMPTKNELVRAKNNLEETRDLMMYQYVDSVLNGSDINMDYLKLSSKDIHRQKANAKIAKALDKKKRGFCD